MAVDVTTSVVIRRPPSTVAAFAGDPGNAPSWYANISSVVWESEPSTEIGSRAAFVAHFLGRTLSYTYEIVELARDELMVMRTAEGPFPMETRYRWEPTGEGHTRMTLQNLGTPRGFSRLVAPFMEMAMRRANRKGLAALKGLLEAQPMSGSLASSAGVD